MPEDIVRIMCPNITCKRVLGVPVQARGKLVRCRSCGMTVRVPAAKEPAVKPQPQPPAEDAAAA